jgi:hypothetical protein
LRQRSSLVFNGLVVARVHVPLEGAREIELALLDLLAGGGEHGLGKTH